MQARTEPRVLGRLTEVIAFEANDHAGNGGPVSVRRSENIVLN